MKPELSPYYAQPGQEKLLYSGVALLDILGFSAFARSADDSGIRRLASVLRDVYSQIREQSAFSESEKRSFDIKVFTDNLVIGYPIPQEYGPILGDGESQLGTLFRLTAELQCSLVRGGFLARGGIDVGPLYMDSDVVIGEGLIRAHEGDTAGGMPRIVLGSTTRTKIDKHLGYYARAAESPQNHYLMVDSDGAYFVNYLSLAWDDLDEVDLDVLGAHKNLVESGLKSFVGATSMRAKYVWAAQYHNMALEALRSTLRTYRSLDEYKESLSQLQVPTALYAQSMRRLV